MTTASVSTVVQFIKYLVIGGLNTLGAGAIIFALQAAGVHPIIANLTGYAISIGASFILNSRITFRVDSDRAAAIRFLVVMGVSYLANLGTMLAVLRLTHAPYLAQASGIPVYTIVGFVGNKYWALKKQG